MCGDARGAGEAGGGKRRAVNGAMCGTRRAKGNGGGSPSMSWSQTRASKVCCVSSVRVRRDST